MILFSKIKPIFLKDLPKNFINKTKTYIRICRNKKDEDGKAYNSKELINRIFEKSHFQYLPRSILVRLSKEYANQSILNQMINRS